MLGFSKYQADKKGRLMVGLPKKYSRYGFKEKVHTYLSSDLSTYVGHKAFGGVHLRTLSWGTRYAKDASNPTTCGQKTLDTLMDMRRPYEFLMSSDADPAGDDTKIGFDYFFPSRTLVEKMRNARIIDTAAEVNDDVQVYMRTNDVKHDFIFTNYGRHDVLIIFEHLFGDDWEEWSYSPAQPNLVGTTYSDLHAITDWADQKGNLEMIVVPAVKDNNDRGLKVSYPIKCNFNRAWGDEYKSSIPDFSNNDGVWYNVSKDWLSSSITQQGVGVGEERPLMTPCLPQSQSQTQFDYHIKMHALLLDPHGKVVTADRGATTADSRGSLDSNALNIEVVSHFDLTMAVDGHPHGPRHYGRWARAGSNAPP